MGRESLLLPYGENSTYPERAGRSLVATRDVTAKEIAYRGGDLLRVLQQEHVAAAIYLSHFAIG
jgi:hypothetical protein